MAHGVLAILHGSKPARNKWSGRSPTGIVRELRRRITHDWHLVRRLELMQMKKWLAPKPTDIACDIGCGDGYYTQQLLGDCAMAAGIDVDTATMAAAPLADTRVRLTVSSAEALPFPTARFDAVIGVCALEHFGDDVQALREIKRTLRPGGEVVLSVDSLSLPAIPARYVEIHRQRHFVTNLYRVEDLRVKLQTAGLELLDHRYIITSPLAFRLVEFASGVWKGLTLFFPLFYPLILVAERLTGPGATAGFILIVRAAHARDA